MSALIDPPYFGKLSKLADISIASPANGQVLTYNSTSGKWTNQTGGGGGAVSSVSNSDGTLAISPTTGAVVASLALGHANTWTGTQSAFGATWQVLHGATDANPTSQLGDGFLAFGAGGASSTDLSLTRYALGIWDTNYSHLRTEQIAPAGNPTVAINPTAGNLNGTYYYSVTFVTALGETSPDNISASVSPVNQQVNLTNIPIGPAGVIARKIYRNTAANNNLVKQLVTTISDNTTTSYTDNVADASLGAFQPGFNSTGGLFYLSGNLRLIADSFLTALGVNAGQVNSGYYNTFFGVNSGHNNTTGNYNTFFGFNTGPSNTTGYNNTFFGYGTGYNNTTGNSNTFFGFDSGANNTTGNSNTFFGFGSGYVNSTGFNNTFFGYSSGYNNTTGFNNTLFGFLSGSNNTTGSRNSVFGYEAFYNYNNTTSVNGFHVAIGYQAGFNYTGSEINNIILGSAQSSSDIAAGIAGESNVIRIGNSSSLNAYLGGPVTSSTTTLLNSVTLNLLGSYWNGSASVPYGFRIYSSIDATTPAAHLSFNLNNNGTITELMKLTGGGVIPAADATYSLGTSSLRWLDIIGNNFEVFHALGDANPTSQLGDGQIQFGPGGATAVDTTLSRVTSPTTGLNLNLPFIANAGVIFTGTVPSIGLSAIAAVANDSTNNLLVNAPSGKQVRFTIGGTIYASVQAGYLQAYSLQVLDYQWASLSASYSLTNTAYRSTGLGVTITPQNGKILVRGTIVHTNNTVGDGSNVELLRGTSGIPAQGSTVSDTQLWTEVYTQEGLGGNDHSDSFEILDSGLTSGTAYSYYYAVKAVTGGTATVQGGANQTVIFGHSA